MPRGRTGTDTDTSEGAQRLAWLEEERRRDKAILNELRKKQEQVCRELNMPYELAQCLTRQAELLGIPLGRPKEAKPMIEEAERLARQVGVEPLLREIHSIKGQISLASLF